MGNKKEIDGRRAEERKQGQEKRAETDRIRPYLLPLIQDFLFSELSLAHLRKTGMEDILYRVPVPIGRSDLNRLTNGKIAHNMALVIGCDTHFPHKEAYITYIRRSFGKAFARMLAGEGAKNAQEGKAEYAAALFRASLLIDSDFTDALYGFARACKDAYDVSDEETYIGNFKAESLCAFERLTLKAPSFDMGFYFLGYAYLNMGLYRKANLTWESFLDLADEEESSDKAAMIAEIREWQGKLKEPVKIETAYNHILAGRYQEGLEGLEAYREDNRFNTWWPLWFYLGCAYEETDRLEEAEDAYKRVLRLAPSHTDTMERLADLYRTMHDPIREKKYRDKIKLVHRNQEEDRRARADVVMK